MCVAAIAWGAHPDWPLIVIGNRDEYHRRAAAPLARWSDGRVIAGRDLEAGGTWLGVSEGRFGLVTNLRVAGYPRPELATRGALVTDWLRGASPDPGAAMNPFNLWLADARRLVVLSNHPHWQEIELPNGIHGLSNGAHHDRWFKTRRLEAALAYWLDRGDNPATLFAPLRDEETETADPEDAFSSVFIRNPTYGTRCSTVIVVDRAGRGRIAERSFDAAGEQVGEVTLEFAWPAYAG